MAPTRSSRSVRVGSTRRKGDATPGSWSGGIFSSRNRDLWFTGDVRNLDKTLRRIQVAIDNFIEGGGDTSALLERLKSRQIRRWVRNYNQEGGEYGATWAKYIRKPQRNTKYGSKFTSGRNKRYDQGSTLKRTGTQYGQHADQMESAATLTGGSRIGVSWKFSNDVDAGYYAVSHHTGYTFANDDQSGIEVPARKLWDLDAEDERLSHRMYSEWAHKIFREMLG